MSKGMIKYAVVYFLGIAISTMLAMNSVYKDLGTYLIYCATGFLICTGGIWWCYEIDVERHRRSHKAQRQIDEEERAWARYKMERREQRRAIVAKAMKAVSYKK